MELIMISESKLKIMLTADEMENYSISGDSLTYEKNETRKAFGRILDEAKEKTGFDSAAGRLLIQVFPSKSGGCEVYVTKSAANDFQTGKTGKKAAEKSGQQQKKRKEYCAFAFSNLFDVVSACSVLKESGYSDESELYSVKKSDGYYLILQEEYVPGQQNRKRKTVGKCDLAEEFGKRIGGKNAVMYIKEHADNILSSGAVEKIGGL